MRKQTKTCPMYVIQTVVSKKTGDVEFHAIMRDNNGPYRAGTLKTSGPIPGFIRYQVGLVDVNDDYRRCGIGTKLYEAAAKYGCEKHKEPLTSSTIGSLSRYSFGFWRKQEAKGRATRMGPPIRGSYYALTCPVPKTLSKRTRRR